MTPNPTHVIVFDGVCVLCNTAVQFILKRDHQELFYFTPLQSEYAQSLLAQHQLTEEIQDTFIYINKENVFQRSDAALQIASELCRPWRYLKVLKWLPRRLRDGIYGAIAKNRYKLFGKREACLIPDEKTRSRIIQ